MVPTPRAHLRHIIWPEGMSWAELQMHRNLLLGRQDAEGHLVFFFFFKDICSWLSSRLLISDAADTPKNRKALLHRLTHMICTRDSHHVNAYCTTSS